MQNLININTEIRFGKPCIVGTRITVSDILQWLASGMTSADIVKDFPPTKNRAYKCCFAICLSIKKQKFNCCVVPMIMV